jgi:hypothetical protein
LIISNVQTRYSSQSSSGDVPIYQVNSNESKYHSQVVTGDSPSDPIKVNSSNSNIYENKYSVINSIELNNILTQVKKYSPKTKQFSDLKKGIINNADEAITLMLSFNNEQIDLQKEISLYVVQNDLKDTSITAAQNTFYISSRLTLIQQRIAYINYLKPYLSNLTNACDEIDFYDQKIFADERMKTITSSSANASLITKIDALQKQYQPLVDKLVIEIDQKDIIELDQIWRSIKKQ